MTLTYTLPEGFTCRPASMEDVEAVFALNMAVDIALYGKTDESYTIDDLRSGWLSSDFVIAQDSWIVFAPTGQVVGFAAIWNNQHARLYTRPIVLPAYAHTEYSSLYWLWQRRERGSMWLWLLLEYG